ncbi:MAG: hypothetical protein KDA16_03830 [Phycisphaerales bacterium]|nr:hypothetical protein [Phycisphaerales bacterium]
MYKHFSACALIALAAGVAQAGVTGPSPTAASFSFASDQADMSWTFFGFGDQVLDGMNAEDPIKLVVDDANGICPSVKLFAEFSASFTLSGYTATNIFGSTWLHSYNAAGSFGFNDPVSGAPWLTAFLGDSVFTSPGSQFRWSSTGAALGSDDFGAVVYVATQEFVDAINAALDGTGCTAADLNVFAGQSVSPDDFGFDLSLLNSGPNGVAIDPQTGLPIATWRSEGSYSGSATFVPTPGAAALAGLGLVTVSRRRRSK